MTRRQPTRQGVAIGFVVGVLGVLCMAPTPGDVGGCGTTVTELNVDNYAYARKQIDCDRCNECSLHTTRCVHACDPNAPPDTSLPTTCRPLEHDGEVCVRALHYASCSDYATYVTDTPSIPSECDFCKTGTPTPIVSIAPVDAGHD